MSEIIDLKLIFLILKPWIISEWKQTIEKSLLKTGTKIYI
jgi:hypothetical protein